MELVDEIAFQVIKRAKIVIIGFTHIKTHCTDLAAISVKFAMFSFSLNFGRHKTIRNMLMKLLVV